MATIRRLLEFYSKCDFILIGDSGQHDPVIYSKLALEFPGRIEAIFIRKIRTRSFFAKDENIKDKLSGVKTGCFEVKNSYETAQISQERGYINKQYFKEIESELQKLMLSILRFFHHKKSMPD